MLHCNKRKINSFLNFFLLISTRPFLSSDRQQKKYNYKVPNYNRKTCSQLSAKIRFVIVLDTNNIMQVNCDKLLQKKIKKKKIYLMSHFETHSQDNEDKHYYPGFSRNTFHILNRHSTCEFRQKVMVGPSNWSQIIFSGIVSYCYGWARSTQCVCSWNAFFKDLWISNCYTFHLKPELCCSG